jgi:LmbE family N-acetylglucosaminyl deacetylase
MEFCILAIGAHADDIELQMGGTLSKYQSKGYDIGYVMATNNMSGGEEAVREDGDKRPLHLRTMENRKREANDGAKFYGTTAIHLDHPQRHYKTQEGQRVQVEYGSKAPEGIDPSIPNILIAHEHKPSVRRVTDIILDYNPEVVFTHGGQIANLEHLATALLVAKAYWQAREEGYQGMLAYWFDLGVNELGDLHKYSWQTHVDISDFWEAKMQGTLCHKTMKPNPPALDWPQWGPACRCRHAEVFSIGARTDMPVQQGAITTELLANRRF